MFAGMLAAGLLAQGQQDAPKPETAEGTTPVFRLPVEVVVAPVSVTDHDGDSVDGLGPEKFRLFDNGKEQNIHVDVAFPPISLVIAVQANDHVESVLPQIQKIGAMIEPIVIGEPSVSNCCKASPVATTPAWLSRSWMTSSKSSMEEE